jgi:hypothetical protein
MITSFLRSFVPALIASGAIFGLIVLLVIQFIFREPPERFAARGFSFELPRDWECGDVTDQSADCTPKGNNASDAVIIVAMKTANSDDTLKTWQSYLSKPKAINNSTRPKLISTVKYVRNLSINGSDWLDAKHNGSEISGYDTRYTGGVAGATAILFSFSCLQERCGLYETLYENVLASLRFP